MKAETTYMKTLGKVEAKLSRMKEQAAAVRWFYENGNLLESYNRALRLEELSEQTVLLTRVLPAYTGAVGATTQRNVFWHRPGRQQPHLCRCLRRSQSCLCHPRRNLHRPVRCGELHSPQGTELPTLDGRSGSLPARTAYPRQSIGCGSQRP